ncbi:MAG: SUMF1/EgtB/PvdO family nonheme iron enzyme, partial [Nocardioides sp.]
RVKHAIDFFISYDTDDLTQVENLSDQLERADYRTWYSQRRVRSGHWRTKVEDALDAATCFLLAVSATTTKSKEVENEFRRAQSMNKPMLLVYLEDCRPPIYAAALHATHFGKPTERSIREIGHLFADACAFQREAEEAYLQRIVENVGSRVSDYYPLPTVSVSEGIAEAPNIQDLVESALAQYSPSTRTVRTSLDLLAQVQNVDGPHLRVQLTGESGAGKSFTLLYFLHVLSSTALTDPTAPIPIFVQLKSYRSGLPFIDHIRNVATTDFPEVRGYLESLLAQGRVVLLVDGLNEMPAKALDLNIKLIRVFLMEYSQISVVVTSLFADYTPERGLGLDEVELRRLTPIHIQDFVNRHIQPQEAADKFFWGLIDDDEAPNFLTAFLKQGGTREQFWLHRGLSPLAPRPEEARPFFQWDLWVSERDNPLSLLNLVGNPYMLSLSLHVFSAAGALPPNRYSLLSTFYQVMFDAAAGRRQDKDAQESFLSVLAVRMHKLRQQSVSSDDLIEAGIDGQSTHVQSARQARILDLGDLLTFAHPLLREFFAASHVELLWRSGESVLDLSDSVEWWELNGWEDAIILLAGKYARDPERFLNWLRDSQPELASQCVVREACKVSEQYLQSLAAAWLPRLTHDKEAPRARAAIGRALGRLNIDSRPGVCVLDNQGLPLFEWCRVVASTERAGSQRVIDVSKFLVTNSQFRPFVLDGGYTEAHRDCWTDAGWSWRSLVGRVGPDDYTEVFRLPNHPRIGTVWYEVVAYTRWLTKAMRNAGTLGQEEEVRLLSELEFEACAMGHDRSRRYPWGDVYDDSRCNVRELRSTSTVGLYPSGASPEGIHDLVGNAWTWCSTKWDANAATQDNDLEGDGPRVYRGGSWAFDFNVSIWRPEELEGSRRYWIDPRDDRPDAIGFFVSRAPSY